MGEIAPRERGMDGINRGIRSKQRACRDGKPYPNGKVALGARCWREQTTGGWEARLVRTWAGSADCLLQRAAGGRVTS